MKEAPNYKVVNNLLSYNDKNLGVWPADQLATPSLLLKKKKKRQKKDGPHASHKNTRLAFAMY